MKENRIVVGVDIGGSHITTALVDIEQRMILPESFHRYRVNAQGDYHEIADAWTYAISTTMGHTIYPIGIAMPGPFDYEKGISRMRGQHKYDALYGMNVKALLAERLPVQLDRIRMANDATCFLQGEVMSGSVQGKQHVMGFTIGTGFGAAIADNGLAQDATYYDFPFKDSKAEEYFSARWFVKRMFEKSGKQINNVQEIALLAKDNADAAAVFQEFGSNLASFFQLLEPMPETIVLGGNIAKTFSLFQPAMQSVLQQQKMKISIVPSSLGENAALMGAAQLFDKNRPAATDRGIHSTI